MSSATTPLDTAARTQAATPPPAALVATLQMLRQAQRAQGAPGLDARRDALLRLERALLSRREEIAAAIAQDFGHRARQESLSADVMPVVLAARHARTHLRTWMADSSREVPWWLRPARARVIHQPLGVVGIISPWNYPINLALSPLISVLAAGNRAMLKPSELSPASTAMLESIVREAFAPDQVVVVAGDATVAAAFSRLPFDHLVFTGSTRVGRLVMRAASENLTPVTLELGGKSPAIVADAASIERGAQAIAAGKLFNAGQTCIAPDYALIPEGTRDAFVAAFRAAVGKLYPTLRDNPDYTAVVSDAHFTRLQGYVAEARARGLDVVEINPGTERLDPATRKFAPTLVFAPPSDTALAHEEIFGPILPVYTFGGIDAAIDFVNDRPRPLALYYFDDDTRRTERVLRSTSAGGVTVNDTLLHFVVDDVPFGGVGPSGMGHYHGREGFEAFSKKKPVLEQSRLNGVGLVRPPYGRAFEAVIRLLGGGR